MTYLLSQPLPSWAGVALMEPDPEPAWVAAEAFDVEGRGYVLVPDGDGWTVLAPPLGPCVWVGTRPPGSRELVAEEAASYDDARAAAVDHLAELLEAAWCDRCGDQGVCPDCVGA